MIHFHLEPFLPVVNIICNICIYGLGWSGEACIKTNKKTKQKKTIQNLQNTHIYSNDILHCDDCRAEVSVPCEYEIMPPRP